MDKIVKDDRLPKAPVISVSFGRYWFRWLLTAIQTDNLRRSLFWMHTRGANFRQFWIGPLSILCRAPWLSSPARQHIRQHYPEQNETEVQHDRAE